LYYEEFYNNILSAKDLGCIKPELMITRYAYQYKEPLKAVLKELPIGIYTNLYTSRDRLYNYLNAKNDFDAYKKLISALENPLKPREEDFGNYFTITEAALLDIPFIKYYREDGGYFLTSSIILACIDETCNASYHRIMRYDGHKATVRIVPRHLYKIYKEYMEKDRDTPVAIALGLHPVIELACAMSPPFGVYELWIANRLLNNELKVVYTPLHNIPVPSTAMVVLEGYLLRETDWEGPFVDILRIPDQRRLQPVFKLEKIYVNNIFEKHFIHAIVPGLEEHLFLMGFPREALIWDSVRRVSPNVKGVRLTLGGGGWLHAVISVSKTSDGEPKNIILAAFTGHPSLKHVIVVDDDINIDDPYEIEWAIATRFQASKDLIIVSGVRGSTLDPSGDNGIVDKMGIDATIPLDKKRDLFRRAPIP